MYDCVGGPNNWDQASKIMKPGGRYLSIAGDGGFQPLNLKALAVFGYRMTVRSWPFTDFWFRAYTCFPNGEDLTTIADLMRSGEMKAVIDSVHPMANIKDAFARLLSGHAKGKIVITIP